MTVQRRRAISTPGDRKDPAARGPGTAVVSIALHFVAILVLIQLTWMPSDWLADMMRRDPPKVVERVGFLQLPRGERPTESPRRGGNNLPVTSAVRAAPRTPVAPVEIPRGLPPVPSVRPPSAVDIGTGPLVGGGGDTRGVRPSYTEPRLWAPSTPVVTAPLTATGRLDSAMLPIFTALADSMRRAAANYRNPNDWTKTIGGRKYGIDEKYIRLGPVSIPTALLAFLPLNVQGNPTQMERNRRLDAMRVEILEQAARAARDEDFHTAVKALRERKQKERDDKKKADIPPAKIIP